ncbi:unnamed protein product [Polarella glacialis]|uniref:Uncharacterized protein n=1 Tax=Polarella glacialis TaxID=89957 RepID=A0A813F7D8_POLGL|nr:unnamed protein product [Polarella glacialis]
MGSSQVSSPSPRRSGPYQAKHDATKYAWCLWCVHWELSSQLQNIHCGGCNHNWPEPTIQAANVAGAGLKRWTHLEVLHPECTAALEESQHYDTSWMERGRSVQAGSSSRWSRSRRGKRPPVTAFLTSLDFGSLPSLSWVSFKRLDCSQDCRPTWKERTSNWSHSPQPEPSKEFKLQITHCLQHSSWDKLKAAKSELDQAETSYCFVQQQLGAARTDLEACKEGVQNAEEAFKEAQAYFLSLKGSLQEEDSAVEEGEVE